MQRTTIEWTDYTWNPVTGCKNHCPYCYARKIATRFNRTKAWPNDFEPTYHPDRLVQPLTLKKPSRIFVCSMGELFGNWIPSEWIESIIAITWVAPYHTYQVLTKFPHNLNNWQFPQWWWVGTTIDNNQWERGHELLCNCDAVIKFISFEPLLAKPTGRLLSYVIPVMDWIIIGAQTNPYKPPKQEWITAILEAANVSGKPVPVFMKNNLKPIWPGVLQQQWPNDNLADFQGHRQTVTA